ncbi:transporter substrate-binding domain-containing protein [Pseudodesulfovibrio nedwellii]|uniref:transporter substrate-binding domain-containing protein n=1 Tax=Pseudodesulfovibrio nedwellii TaxID=2973072 RepID=UPI002492133A|nr:transporter substrate-binding domain-containing protein [Pseudodesulfovibrio nedwellii]
MNGGCLFFYRWIFCSALAVVCLLAFLFCYPSSSVAEDDPFGAYRSKGIIVAQESDMPPMSFVGPSGRPKGFIIDLWRKWSSETGVPVHFHLVEWAETLNAVREGKADVHGGLFYTAGRDRYLDYSSPFFVSRGVVLVVNGSAITDISQLRGKNVGVIDKSFYDALLREKYPALKPYPIENTTRLVEAAVNGEVEVVMGDYPTVMHQIGSMGKVRFFRVIEFVSDQYYRAAVAQGNEVLLTMIEKGLERIDKEERKVLFERWVVGGHTPSRSWLASTIVISVLSLGLALLVPFVFDRFRR